MTDPLKFTNIENIAPTVVALRNTFNGGGFHRSDVCYGLGTLVNIKFFQLWKYRADQIIGL
jgi:hypothetical protein